MCYYVICVMKTKVCCQPKQDRVFITHICYQMTQLLEREKIKHKLTIYESWNFTASYYSALVQNTEIRIVQSHVFLLFLLSLL